MIKNKKSHRIYKTFPSKIKSQLAITLPSGEPDNVGQIIIGDNFLILAPPQKLESYHQII